MSEWREKVGVREGVKEVSGQKKKDREREIKRERLKIKRERENASERE